MGLYMEKLLEKMARQLEAIDEASLMALWSKYATATSRFEPTKRWEEACLIFSLIQAKHFKNQLFNYCWQQERRLDRPMKEQGGQQITIPAFGLDAPTKNSPQLKNTGCRVLSFTPKKNNVDNGDDLE